MQLALTKMLGHVNGAHRHWVQGSVIHASCYVHRSGDEVLHLLGPVPAALEEHGQINHRAKINVKDKHAYTPLHCAVEQNHRAVVEFLLAHGADVNAKTKKGLTPLSLAQKKGHNEVAAVLRQRGGTE